MQFHNRIVDFSLPAMNHGDLNSVEHDRGNQSKLNIAIHVFLMLIWNINVYQL